jgi:leucyl-tRNA synthetase
MSKAPEQPSGPANRAEANGGAAPTDGDGAKRAYDPQKIERKWQTYWEKTGFNTPDLDAARSPFYTLMMFPYPSAEGLHVGNCFAFTGVDIQGRYRRLLGHDVFEPIGFDAFGIHSENYALKIGVHPTRLIPNNVANFRRQLKRIGLMVDWSREVSTIDPEYYRWTQWIFLQLYQHGLAYRAVAPVNWCPACATVISDEQVISGFCERHPEARVERRDMQQWFFRITAYAQRLLDNLSWIDWSETTRRAQINWIGRSVGAELCFPVSGRSEPIRVFTTRPDTVFGATYMVLAPENPLVDELARDERRAEIEAYRLEAKSKNAAERMDAGRDKTGVFIGAHAVNPATAQAIPIWISDYVLMGYGTGAIMAVPAHDTRDFEFATKFGLPIVEVIGRPDGEGAGETTDGKERGGVGETSESGAHECYAGEGIMMNSGSFDGLPSPEAWEKIIAFLGERDLAEPKVQYRLRDWCISRQRYWGPPIPMIHCPTCDIVPVPEEDLPVLLPEVEDFRPLGTGVSPLARVESFYHVTCPRCGGPARRDTDVNDNFLDSAWYFLRYPSARDGGHAWDPERTKKWLPVDFYIGGNEHAVLHLMYTRFLCMAFHDMGLTHFEEPFKRFRAHGLLIKDGNKMSKSRGNVVNPDSLVAQYGADTFRTNLMFLGPYEEGGDFREAGIVGVFRFLDRVHRWYTEELPNHPVQELPREGRIKLHQTIQKVGRDIEALSYNTAVAALMECHNALRGYAVKDSFAADSFAVMLAPFAPHLAEEIWESLGHRPSICAARWPVFDPALTVEETVEVAVQVNGKMRGTVTVPRDATQDMVQAAALAVERIRAHTEGKTPRKVFFVPNRLINIIAN